LLLCWRWCVLQARAVVVDMEEGVINGMLKVRHLCAYKSQPSRSKMQEAVWTQIMLAGLNSSHARMHLWGVLCM
jgi:hypothetical protein